MTTCLVLGGNGFIGSHLVEALLRKGFSVKVFGDFKSGTKNLDAISHRIEIIKGDFLCESDLAAAMQNVEFVFHYISTTNPVTSFNNPCYEVETNIIGSIRMMELAVKNDIKKIIFPSTGGTIYGEPDRVPINEAAPTNPLNPYAISKLTIEKYLNYFFHRYSLDYLVLRYSNPYGERQNPYGNQGVIPIFLNKINNNEDPTIFGDGSAIRDYIYIQDALDATLSLFDRKCNEKIFNVGSGRGNSINELISIMSEVTGKEIRPIYVNNNGFYIKKIILDISKIKNITGWSPKIDIFDGIEKTWNWIKS
jgi:UDP-glucose 4-epimerase